MKKQFLRFIIFMLLLTLVLSAFSPCAFAAEPIDLQAEVSLNITLKSGETAIPNAEFSLYRVADIDEAANFTLGRNFSAYSGKLTGRNAAEWDAVAEALAKLTQDQKIAAAATGKTDAGGQVKFSEGLKPGLYLAICRETEYEDNIYSARPALVSLPNKDADSGEWDYAVSIKAKAGEPKPAPEPPTPPKPVPPNLPKTGLLWWPVPVLLICGLLLIIMGLTRRKACQNEN